MIKQKSLGTHLVVLILLIMLYLPDTAKSQVQTSGYIEYQDRREDSDTEGRTDMQNATLRIDASTYLWQPWIAIAHGGLSFTYNTLEAESGEQSSNITTGNGEVSFFPRSHFPFRIYAESRDSRVSGDVAGYDYSTRIAGFSQRYIPKIGPRLGIDYRITEQDEIRNFTNLAEEKKSVENEDLKINLKQNFDNNSVNIDANWERVSRPVDDGEDRRHYQLLRHRYHPDTTLSVDNTVSSTQSNINSGTSSSDSQRNQFNSTIFWKPESTKHLMVTGSVLFSETENRINNLSTGLAKSVFVSSGMNYEWTDSLSLRLTASMSDAESVNVDSESSIVKAGLNYNGKNRKLSVFDYQWNAQSDVSNRSGHENSVNYSIDEYSLGAGHSIGKGADVADGYLQLRFSQLGQVLVDSNDRKEDLLSHSMMLGWSTRNTSSSTIAQLTATDRRRTDVEKNIYQVINLQLSRSQQINRMQSWAGNLTVQSSRTQNEVQDSGWQSVASIDVNYNNQRVFDISRLRFYTEYRYLSEELARTVLDNNLLEQKITHYWKNRFEYQVGRINLSLHGNITERDSKREKLIMLMLRRNFGENGF